MTIKSISAIIVDDASQARKLLRLMLAEIAPDVKLLGEAANAHAAAILIKSTKPDVVFLDIEMPGKSGLQLVEEISKDIVPFEIIFTTAYNEYAIRAFRLSAIDYLLKPIDEKQLAEAVEKIRHKRFMEHSEKRLQTVIKNLKAEAAAILSVPTSNGYVFLKTAEIMYIKADGSYTEIYTSNALSIVVSRNLKYFEEALLSFGQFVRIHRSYLINIQQMQCFDKGDRGTIVMNDNTTISLARERREIFLKAIEQ